MQTTIFEDAVVVPMTDPGARATALAIRGDRIVAVGTPSSVRAAVGSDSRSVSLGGRALLPGFIDAHHHFLQAVVYGGAVELTDVRTLDELCRRFAAAAHTTPPGAWILGHGYDPALLVDQRRPTRRELDAACPAHPLLAVEYSFHDGVTNSRGLAAMGYTPDVPDPQGGGIERGRRGELTGRVAETALFAVEAVAREALVARSAEQILERLSPYQNRLFEAGITCVCEPGVPPQNEALFRRAVQEGKLTIVAVMMPIGAGGFAAPPRDRLEGASTGEGSELLRVGPMKLVFDGASRCAMCLTLSQFVEAALMTARNVARKRSLTPIRASLDVQAHLSGRLVRTGSRFYSPIEGQSIVREACEHGFAVAIHAIGNEAVEQALEAIAASRSLHRDVPPPRIEHAMALTPALIRRAADLGVAIVTQPDFLRLPALEELPPPSGFRYWGMRSCMDAGVLVAGSSDAPVSTFDPLDGIRSAIRRRTRSGRVFQQDEAVGVWQALSMYTRIAAEACGIIDVTGTLESGKRADLVVLNRDPLSGNETSLDDLAVEATYVGGSKVYEARS